VVWVETYFIVDMTSIMKAGSQRRFEAEGLMSAYSVILIFLKELLNISDFLSCNKTYKINFAITDFLLFASC